MATTDDGFLNVTLRPADAGDASDLAFNERTFRSLTDPQPTDEDFPTVTSIQSRASKYLVRSVDASGDRPAPSGPALDDGATLTSPKLSMASSQVRFATIGSNFIVEAFLEAAKSVPGFLCTAVYSRSADRAAEFASRYGVALTFTSLEALGKCTEVDAVYIASPTACHASQAIQMLEAGKHVLCEKPACSHATELRRVIQAAKASGKAFMEGMRPLKTPAFEEVRRALADLGSPVSHFSGSFCQLSSRWPAYLRGERPSAFLPAMSNGALMDIGSYAIYSAVALLGRPDSVSYSPLMLPTGVDGGGTVLLRYKGSLATLVISKMSHSWNHSELQTDRGTIRIDSLSEYGEVHLQKKGGKAQQLGAKGPPGLGNIVYELRAFVAMVQSGKVEDSTLTWKLALDVAEVLEKARDDAGIVFPADSGRDKRTGKE